MISGNFHSLAPAGFSVGMQQRCYFLFYFSKILMCINAFFPKFPYTLYVNIV